MIQRGKNPKESRVRLVRILTCLNISSSSRRLLSSTCRRPDSSASRILLSRSASMLNAWILLSSCSRINSFDRKSSMSPAVALSASETYLSITDSCKRPNYKCCNYKYRNHKCRNHKCLNYNDNDDD